MQSDTQDVSTEEQSYDLWSDANEADRRLLGGASRDLVGGA